MPIEDEPLVFAKDGYWSIEINEFNGFDGWLACVMGPTILFNFEIDSLDFVEDLFHRLSLVDVIEVLDLDEEPLFSELIVDCEDNKTSVTFITESDKEKRLLIDVRHPDSSFSMIYAVMGEDFQNLLEVTRQVRDKLAELPKDES